ncbi:MAG: hypothetical protein JSR18_11555 [Proteobacteria bacterium]|nr:hypothetical protein [Pseudomonadota bacterium]
MDMTFRNAVKGKGTHGCPARRAARRRRRNGVLAVMAVLALAVMAYGQRWMLVEAPPSDPGYTAASAAASALVSFIN